MRRLRPGIGIQTSRNGVHHRQLGNIRQRSSGGQSCSDIACEGTYADDSDQSSVGFLNLECERDQEDGNRVECLISARLKTILD